MFWKTGLDMSYLQGYERAKWSSSKSEKDDILGILAGMNDGFETLFCLQGAGTEHRTFNSVDDRCIRGHAEIQGPTAG